jgi:hypothetical protein
VRWGSGFLDGALDQRRHWGQLGVGEVNRRHGVLGTDFSMAGSTSFGWMTPFDWFSFLLRFWARAVGLAPGVVGAGLGAWANAEPATSVINTQSREPMAVMSP